MMMPPGGGMPPPPGGANPYGGYGQQQYGGYDQGGGYGQQQYGGYDQGGGYGQQQSQKAEQADKLNQAAEAMTGGKDGAGAFLDRYRAGGMAVAGAGRGQGGVRQTQLGGAALEDKHGNLI